MEIGEVIRKYRKEKNMTQEEMAKRLGITAPAVNKWEHGISQPDISLLAPVARLLGITLETLLSFKDELSQEEISSIIKEIDRKFETENYCDVFQYAADIIKQYPDCGQLIWQLALILDSHSIFPGNNQIQDKERYEKQILEWYKRAMESVDANVQKEAANALFGYYLRKENYKEAEKYLEYFPEDSASRKRMQAVIYSKTGNTEGAYKAYEEILFSECNILNMVFNSLCVLSIKENNIELAEKWADKLSGLAVLFDMGDYNSQSCKLDLAVYKKDTSATLSIVKVMLSSLMQITGYTKSFMYSHMKFKELDKDFYEKLKHMLVEGFHDKETFGYMEGIEEWENLIKR